MGQTQNSQRISELQSKQLINMTSASYGDGSLCEQEKSFIKCMSFQDKTDAKESFHNLQVAQRTVHRNLVRVLNIEECEEKSFCSNVFKIFCELEYFETDLASEVRLRFEENREFNENEIFSIVSDLLNVLAFLEIAAISHQSLSPKSILIDSQLEVKLVHPTLSRNQTNFSYALNSSREKPTYLCPILTKAAVDINYSPKFNPFKSDKFVLGIIILEIFENDYPRIFDGKGQLLEKEVSRRLETIGEFFPTFSKILANLLTEDEEERGNFADSIYFLQNGEFLSKPENRNINLRIRKSGKNLQQANVQKQSDGEPLVSILKPMKIHESKVFPQTNIGKPKHSIRNKISKETEETFESEVQKSFKNKTNSSSFIENVEAKHQLKPSESFSNTRKILTPNLNARNDFNKEEFSKGNTLKKGYSDISLNEDENFFFDEDEDLKKSEASFQIPLKIGCNQTEISQKSILSNFIDTENIQNNHKFKLEECQFASKLNQFGNKLNQPLKECSNQAFDKGESPKFDLQTILAEERLKRELKSTLSNPSDAFVSKEVYADGSSYSGNLCNGLREGKGVLIYPDGSKYEGMWKEGQMHGVGCLYYASGKLAYSGEWANDKFHGKGTVYNEIAEYFENPINFQNIEIQDDMWTKYEGGLDYDNKEGFGVWEFSNGESYKGNFKNDMINGVGMFRRFDGTLINAIWEKNELKAIQNT